MGSGRRSSEKAGRADADISAGGRRVAAAAPVTTACVPVSGEWPAAGGVAGGLRSAGAPPGSPAGVSGVGFAGLGVQAGAGPPLSGCCGRGRRGVLVGCVPPPLVVPPSPSPRWRGRVLSGVFPGSSLETFSLFYVVLDWAACTLCFGSWIFLLLGDSFFFPSANDP